MGKLFIIGLYFDAGVGRLAFAAVIRGLGIEDFAGSQNREIAASPKVLDLHATGRYCTSSNGTRPL